MTREEAIALLTALDDTQACLSRVSEAIYSAADELLLIASKLDKPRLAAIAIKEATGGSICLCPVVTGGHVTHSSTCGMRTAR